MSRADLVLAFRTSLADGGWPIDWADAVADENLAIAMDLPEGAVIGRRLDGILLARGQANDEQPVARTTTTPFARSLASTAALT